MANELLYGFHKGLRDSINLPVADVEVRVVSQAIQESLDQHERDLEDLFGLFVERTTDHKRRYETDLISRNQPLDAVGRAIAGKGGGYYDVAWPIRRSGQAWGYDWEALQYMTVQQINNRQSAMLIGDIRWLRDHMLAALFTNVPYTFKDERYGDLTIQPLANNDAARYLKLSASEDGDTDTHFLAQANNIADAYNPFPMIKQELVEHPENGDTVVALVGSNLRDEIEALATFTAYSVDRDVTPGEAVDRINTTAPSGVPGEIFGKVGGVWISEWARIPNDYIVATTVDSDAKPLRMRQPELPQLQGFRQYGERQDWPWFEKQLRRYAGFGAWNRVGAVVMRIGNGTYAIPANLQAPLKV